MKYQVYLNKETSLLLNEFSTALNVKPNTMIKSLIEGNKEAIKEGLERSANYAKQEESKANKKAR